MMKTIVLDDDPTGTQSASGVGVLLQPDQDALEKALSASDSVYVLTNSRSIDEAHAVNLVRGIRDDGLKAGEHLGEDVRFVLRGDSTLRGHVFAESDVFAVEESIMVFVPAFPDGGRTTTAGTHFVEINGTRIPAHETEYAHDPVFPFSHSNLVEFVAEKSTHPARHIALSSVREGDLTHELLHSSPGTVVVPDALTNSDIDAIAHAITSAQLAGKKIVVRCASPLAAALAGVASNGLLPYPLSTRRQRTLLVCGSHTDGATRQLQPVTATWGESALIDTQAALHAPERAGERTADDARRQLDERGMAIVTTERSRHDEHNSLDDGAKVMTALVTTVRQLEPQLDIVISKGGITSAEVARVGLGATTAYVRGQILPGVSVWDVTTRSNKKLLYVIVPGNVGDDHTLVSALDAVGIRA